MNKKFLYIANWKMNMPFSNVTKFLNSSYNNLILLANQHSIILCPSFTELPFCHEKLKNSSISLAAQDCSPHSLGAYTGDISAENLKEHYVSFCLLGHSERRLYHKETDSIIAQKAIQLFNNDINPILCIGETKEIVESGKTISFLEKQLSSFLDVIIQLHKQSKIISNIYIAYEPVWSIGTGIIPKKEHLNTIFSWLSSHITKQLKPIEIQPSIKLIYGGSVNPHNASLFKNHPFISGLLIGKASTDFQLFEKIVSL